MDTELAGREFLLDDSDPTITEVARESGLDPGMLSVWVKDARRWVAAAEVVGDLADRPGLTESARRPERR